MSYPPAKGEPILVPCEGSGAVAHIWEFLLGGEAIGICAMCGGRAIVTYELATVSRPAGYVMPDHQRDDILARLERGDFG